MDIAMKSMKWILQKEKVYLMITQYCQHATQKRNANTGKQPPGNKVITTADKQKLGQQKGIASVNKVTPEAKNPK